MFREIPFLQSHVERHEGSICEGQSFFGVTPARVTPTGLIVRHADGELRLRTNNPRSPILILQYTQIVFDKKTSYLGTIDDEVLVKRIMQYLSRHALDHPTNCSTFVEFLRTGVFTRCDTASGKLVYTGSLNRYCGEKIRKGDILCVFYFNARVAKSRKNHPFVRRLYRQNRENGHLADLRKITGSKKEFPKETLDDLWQSGFFTDYHFMYCIGSYDGKPVFIQQMGYYDPRGRNGKSNFVGLIITAGMEELYPELVPALVLIKRGRQ